MSAIRLSVAVALLLGTGTISAVMRGRPARVEDHAATVPTRIDTWRGTDAPPLDEATAAAADRTVNRVYSDGQGRTVGLYLASYGQQHPGNSIHSPLHCLPGTGWSVLTDDVLRLTAGSGQDRSVRRLVAVRDRARIVVLYWYAIHGRMVASDMLSRAYLLYDGLRTGRNDASLIRVVVGVGQDDDGDATRTGMSFVRSLVPHVTMASANSTAAWIHR